MVLSAPLQPGGNIFLSVLFHLNRASLRAKLAIAYKNSYRLTYSPNFFGSLPFYMGWFEG